MSGESGPTTVRAIKGFNADMTCRGFQYAEGETYTHHGEVRPCHDGFHAVIEPIDVFGYYPPASSVYHEVEIEDAQAGTGDSKVAGRVIKIGARVELPELIKAQVDFVMARVGKANGERSDERRGAASSTGYQGAASSTGYQGAASSTGDQGAASSTGYRGAALAIGRAGSASATGTESVAIASGHGGRAKGAIGCVLVLIERDDRWHITAHASALVDGEQIKPDTWYTLRAGKVVTA